MAKSATTKKTGKQDDLFAAPARQAASRPAPKEAARKSAKASGGDGGYSAKHID